MKRYTVGQYLADRLHEIGIEHLFAIPGDYCAEWIHDYITHGPIQRVGAVNELCAGYAADGYARQRGVGALSVTYSVGSFSALNAIAGSYTERVPVVLINGAPSVAKRIQFRETGFQWHHQIDGQDTNMRVFREVTATAERVQDAHLAPGQIDNALRTCLTERLPVYLEMCEDVYDLECELPQGEITAYPPRTDPESLEAALGTITDRLRRAERPLVWAGLELERFGLTEQFEALLEDLHIPYVSSLAGKGVLSEDNPYYLGVFEGPSTPDPVAQAFADADYILGLGTWLTDENLFTYPLPWERLSLVSHGAVRTGTSVQTQVMLGDVIEGIRGHRGLGPYAVPSMPEPLSPSPDSDERLTYQGFYDAIAARVDASTIVVGGSGFNWFGSEGLKVKRPSGFVAQSVYADIGYAAPASVGVTLGAPEGARAMVFAGDGGFQMTAQCLGTMAELGLDTVVFVLDNGVYGIEQWLADPAVYGNDEPFYPLSVLHRWDYAGLSASLGGKGWRVETHGELAKAYEEAAAYTDGPSLIQVVVPDKSVPELAEWKIPGG